MSKKSLITIAIICITIISSQIILSQNMFASAADASKLKIYVGPTNLSADSNSYNCIAVQLQDSKSNPTRAQQDITISLSSSLTNIGDLVNPTIIISKGSTYATAQFQTTYSPGKTTITATSSGFATVQATITTVGPIPSTLVVYGFPAILPADGKAYEGTVIVQLQDSAGNPANAPNEGLTVTLSSSNTAVGTVDSTVTIEGGKTYAAATFTSTMQPGTVSITPVATGYTSKQATFTTQTIVTNPALLKIYLGQPKIPADRATNDQVAVVLQSTSGTIAQAPSDVTITLASSVPEIGTIEETITVPAGESYASAYFYSTYQPGKTVITATATDFKTTQDTITTIGNNPSKLAVYAVPSTLPADYQTSNIIQVQLQDSSGKPAKDPNGDITVSLFSSTTDCGDVASKQLTIPFGETNAQGTFTSTYTANSTTITAQASNYATGQTKITTYLIDQIPLNVSLTPDESKVYPGKNTTISAYVTFNGNQPASNAKITFTSNKGGNFTTPKYEGNGTYTTIFTTPNKSTDTVCNITANVTRTGYLDGAGNVNVTVSYSTNPNETKIGALQMQITQNGDGKPVSDAVVASTYYPTGAKLITGITNSTGYTLFNNIAAGAYTFEIKKEGYETLIQTIIVNQGETTIRTATLNQTPSMLPWIIAIVVIVAVIGAVVGFIFVRRYKMKKRFAKPGVLNVDYNSM